jgi:hypothetical protein
VAIDPCERGAFGSIRRHDIYLEPYVRNWPPGGELLEW